MDLEMADKFHKVTKALVSKAETELKEMLAGNRVRLLLVNGQCIFPFQPDGEKTFLFSVTFVRSESLMFPHRFDPPPGREDCYALTGTLAGAFEVHTHGDGSISGTITGDIEEFVDGSFIDHCKMMVEVMAKPS